jgi:hypothetical protein
MDVMTSEDPLLVARACVLHDLSARGLTDPHTVSIVEDCIISRRWWLAQWPQGAAFMGGLVAQDVQDALLDESNRWPLCGGCDDNVEHSLEIRPELGPDPHWVCSRAGRVVAALGDLAAADLSAF